MKIRLSIYYVLSILIVLGILLFGVFCLYPIFIRTGQVIVELFSSIGFYFQELFQIKGGISINVANTNNYFDGFSLDLIPDDPTVFFKQLGLVFLNLFNKDYFDYRLFKAAQDGRIIILLLSIFLIFYLVLYILFRNYITNDKNSAGYVTKPLLIFDKIVDIYNLVIDEIKSFFEFFFGHLLFKIIFIIEILYFTNLINIFIYFFSIYLYFASSFDLTCLYYFIKKTLIDISFLFRPMYIPLWILVFYFFFRFLFRKIATARIANYHAKDICFVNDLGLLTLITGTMAKGKTTCMTDMGLNAESIFKDTALDMMIKISLEFPEIDFRLFELQLDEAIKKHKVYNLQSCKKWINNKIDNYYLNYCYFDGLKEISLYDVLYNYSQLYWMYTLPSSYIVSNYAVRSGLFVYSDKHLLRYYYDFFNLNSDSYYESMFSHIIDYNNFRPLKKIENRLEWSSSIDIGVFLNDEIGKERLNKNELEDVKKNDIGANQKNDGLNIALKLARHQSTINNFPFFKWFGAEQRSQSVPADYRELNDLILNMSSEMKEKNCYPFYFIIDWFLDLIESLFKPFFIEFRHSRDDTTLIFQISKNVLSKIIRIRKYFDHKYGIKIVYFDLLDGSEQPIGNKKYYLIKQKIYSQRFVTDAYSGTNNRRFDSSEYGLNDLPTYECETANQNEFLLQNSYLINNLLYQNKNDDNKSKKYIWKK